MTGVGRAVDPVVGEMPVTLVALGAEGGSGVGAVRDLPSQAVNPIANAKSKTLR
jgi:hypothetical protein